MTTKVGHMPNLVKPGDTFTIKQAVVYKNKQVTFTITIKIPVEEIGSDSGENSGKDSTVVTDSSSTAIAQLRQIPLDLSATAIQYFDMNGNALKASPKQAGVYLMRVTKNGKALRQSVIRIR